MHGDGKTQARKAALDFGSGKRTTEISESPVLGEAQWAVAEHGFEDFVETQCREFYAEKMGRPSLASGQYFRLLLLGYFECLESERAMSWRVADSLAGRSFLGLGLIGGAPDHSTIYRTRRLIDLDTHRAVFTWVGQCLGIAGLIKGRTIAIDATMLEANAALRSIVIRDTGESYQEFLTQLAKASGIETPRGRNWPGSIVSERTKDQIMTGPIRMTPTPELPRCKTGARI